MDRKDVCALIREHELGEEVKRRFGDNYTRIPTKKLEQILYDYDASLVDEYPYDTKPQPQPAPATKKQEKAQATTSVNNPYEAACLTFLAVLKDSELLDDLLEKL